MARYNPLQFIQEVRQEVSKVTWPSRKETVITTIAVLVMVVISAIFFMLTDLVVGTGVRWVLGLGQ